MKIDYIKEVQGNPIPFIAGAVVGYYISGEVKAKKNERIIAMIGSALVVSFVYINLFSNKNKDFGKINNGVPINGTKQ